MKRVQHNASFTVIDILDVGHSRLSQREKYENSGRQQLDESTDDDGNAAQNKIKFSSTWRFTVQNDKGDMFFMLYRKAPATIPKLGSLLRLASGELHRGIILVNPGEVTIIQQGMNLSRDQIQRRLVIEG